MQHMDSEFTPSILDTPSLMTPNITMNSLVYKPLHQTPLVNDNNNNSSSNPSSITTTTTDESLSLSSADIKLSKIENDLKQSFSQPRKPTESPFQRMVEAGALPMEKHIPIPPTTDDGLPVDIPSTAEVMNDIESFAKYPTKDNTERETTASETNRFDTSPTHNMGVIVSPKKKLLIRSQSHTEPASPSSISTNHFSQSQKANRDDESSTDDDNNNNNHFQRLHDLPTLSHHNTETNSQLNNHIESSYTIQLRPNQNVVQPTIMKQQQQQPIILNNKRPFSQTVIAASLPKGNSILISQQPVVNEVTSSDQLLGIKRQKTTPMPSNTITVRSSFPSPTNDNNNNSSGSDDQRKKQIRDSNREAARRCRERRRTYIEQLEGNLEQCKLQIKQMTENLSRAERENTQLRTILTETKIFQPTGRLSSNESLIDFSAILATTNGVDLNSESTDGNTIQRSYMTRNTH